MLCGSNADGDGVGEMELAVNNCFPNCAQSSDWAVAEVIVWNRALDLDEGISVQEYLRFRRIVPPTPAPQHTPEDDVHKRAEDPDLPWAAHTSLGAPGGGLYRYLPLSRMQVWAPATQVQGDRAYLWPAVRQLLCSLAAH